MIYPDCIDEEGKFHCQVQALKAQFDFIPPVYAEEKRVRELKVRVAHFFQLGSRNTATEFKVF